MRRAALLPNDKLSVANFHFRVLFGAPLATSPQRGGAAYGIAISLATTVLFLMMIQLTKAVGAKGLIPPYLAAWIPNAMFTVAGVFLLARVRT